MRPGSPGSGAPPPSPPPHREIIALPSPATTVRFIAPPLPPRSHRDIYCPLPPLTHGIYIALPTYPAGDVVSPRWRPLEVVTPTIV